MGLAFYKAVMHDVGMSLNLTVVRDRLVGVALGLTMFGIVEHFLWPERATDKLRARLAEILKLLAELARMGACGAPPEVTGNDADSCRRLISQKVEDALGLIESSKFEPGAPEVGEAEKLMGEAQIAFILLLALARQRPGIALPDAVRAAAQELDNAVATALLGMERQVVSGSQPAMPDLADAMDALERSVSASTNAPEGTAADSYLSQLLALYRSLVEAVKRLSSMENPQYCNEA
jgi:multidrug resistance protein MdtO